MLRKRVIEPLHHVHRFFQASYPLTECASVINEHIFPFVIIFGVMGRMRSERERERRSLHTEYCVFRSAIPALGEKRDS